MSWNGYDLAGPTENRMRTVRKLSELVDSGTKDRPCQQIPRAMGKMLSRENDKGRRDQRLRGVQLSEEEVGDVGRMEKVGKIEGKYHADCHDLLTEGDMLTKWLCYSVLFFGKYA